MKISQRFGMFFVTLAMIVVGVVLGSTGVRAEGEDGDENEVFLQLSPSSLEFDLAPGRTEEATIKVMNPGKTEFTYELSVKPYSVGDDQYTADFESFSKYTDLPGWMELSQMRGALAPQETDEITVEVKVPRDVPAGGQYAAIIAKVVPGEGSGGTGIGISQQVAVLTFASVQGNTRRGGKVTENNVAAFLFEPPISATSVVENNGNTHVNAEYVLQVFPLFGNEEVYTNEEHPEKRVILPETKRFNTLTWDGSPQLGLFRVKQTVKILEETSVTEKVVFICPMWFLVIIILLVFCVVFWIVSRIRGRNKAEARE